MIRFRRDAFRSSGGLAILGVRVHAVSMSEAVRRILFWAGSSRAGARAVYSTSVHGVMEAWRDPAFRSLLNRTHLVVPDGMPLVWTARWAGFDSAERIFGPDLMHHVCAATRHGTVSHFFCGGLPGVADALARRLQETHPGLAVAGTLTPPVTPLTREDLQRMAGVIKHSGASIVWVGVSTPKQEQWVASLLPMVVRGVFVTVGAAFDYNTGRIHRAPAWMQEGGLEWTYRLVQEPRRLLLRYLRNNPAFLWLASLQAAGLLRIPPERAEGP